MASQDQGNRHRILVVVRWPVGGIRTFIRYVYTNFDRGKYDFVLIAPDGPELRVLLNDLHDLKVTYIPVPGWLGLKEFMNTIAATIFREKFDLIHSHGLTSGMCSAIPARLKGIPHLLTLHDVFTEKQVEGVSGRMKLFAISLILPLADAIHSVSFDAQDNLLEYIPILRLFPRKLYAIPNGIQTSRFMASERRDLKKELGLDDSAFLIGFLGRFMSQKGFRYLIDALHLLKTEYTSAKRPVVITFGEGDYIREEQEMVRKRGLDQDVYFLPFTSNVASSIKGIDVVVMPSLWEACGLLAMEAMVSGTPLIGTDCIGLREVMKGTPAISVPMRDGKALAQAIYKEMACSSKEKFIDFQKEAAARFDVVRQSEAIEQLMNNLGHFE